MKLFWKSLAMSAAFLVSSGGFAQTSATAPPTAPPAPPSAPAPTNGTMTEMPLAAATTTATKPSPGRKAGKPASTISAAETPDSGHRKVWVNTATKTYYCHGEKYFGTTKAGAYMSEDDARVKGNHPKRKKACS